MIKNIKLWITALCVLSIAYATPTFAIPAVQSCQAPPTSDTSQAFKDGWLVGCFIGTTHYGSVNESDTACVPNKASYKYLGGINASRWANACSDSFDAHVPIRDANLHLLGISVGTSETACSSRGLIDLAPCVKGSLGRISDLTKEESCPTGDLTCENGYGDAQSIYFSTQASTRYPVATIDQGTIDASAALQDCDLKAEQDAHPTLKNASYTNGYKKGCAFGYKQAYEKEHIIDITTSSKPDYCLSIAPDTASSDPNKATFNIGVFTGCRSGVKKAWDVLKPPVANDATLKKAQDLKNCDITSVPKNSEAKNGRAQGCVDGTAKKQADKTFSLAECISGHPYTASTEPYKFFLDYNFGYYEGCEAALAIVQKDIDQNAKSMGNNTGTGIIPDCDPTLPPNIIGTSTLPGGCGLAKFIELIQSIIHYLMLVIIPIAILLLGWAGFKIMTSTGSEEKLGQARTMLTTVITGIVIISLSYLIVQAVFKILGVASTFQGSLFK